MKDIEEGLLAHIPSYDTEFIPPLDNVLDLLCLALMMPKSTRSNDLLNRQLVKTSLSPDLISTHQVRQLESFGALTIVMNADRLIRRVSLKDLREKSGSPKINDVYVFLATKTAWNDLFRCLNALQSGTP